MTASATLQFLASADATVGDRFIQFIRWAEPFGQARIDNVHKLPYVQSKPWFEYSKEFLPRSHNTIRSWFIRAEHLSEEGVFERPKKASEPKVYKPWCLLPDCKFLHFAKAYLNVMVKLRGVRSPPKAMVVALSMLEHAVRTLNDGRNDPELISHLCFQRAAQSVLARKGNPSSKYDVGQELQILAGMLQNGYHSKTFRHSGKGFRLLTTPFVFQSPIPQAPRKSPAMDEAEELQDERLEPITNEAMAALGIAYADASTNLGGDHAAVLMAALPGLALTTTSMRMSDLVELQQDALYVDEDTGRTRIRIYRPKVSESQDLPIAETLESLATEYFNEILGFGADARQAFSYYIERFGGSFESINELFIPERHRALLSQEFLTSDQTWQVLGFTGEVPSSFPQRLDNLSISRAVRTPDGRLHPVEKYSVDVVSIEHVIAACQNARISFHPEIRQSPFRYLTRTQAYRYLRCSEPQAADALANTFEASVRTIQVMRTTDILADLLTGFKSMPFPHWPYTSKDRVTRLDQALLVWNDQNCSSDCQPGNQTRLWWRPTPIAIGTINSWISGNARRPPILFQLLDIRLANGEYPSITIHQTRKRHHTQALLAGVSETFADQLAGRRSGAQSQCYDKRSAKQILSQSIEGFDPDSDYKAIGPAMSNAPPPVKVVERRVFMFTNVAPKQLTDVGGCRSDWSLNPCEMFGDCMRCNKSVWQKGDQKRLPRIVEIHEHEKRMLAVGQERLRRSPHMKTIERHVRQFEETIARCEWIFAVEADPAIAIGTIVSFDSGPTAFTSSELASYLRKRKGSNSNACACH